MSGDSWAPSYGRARGGARLRGRTVSTIIPLSRLEWSLLEVFGRTTCVLRMKDIHLPVAAIICDCPKWDVERTGGELMTLGVYRRIGVWLGAVGVACSVVVVASPTAAADDGCTPVVALAMRGGSGESTIGAQSYGTQRTGGWEGPTLKLLLRKAYDTQDMQDTPILDVGIGYQRCQ